MQGVCFVKASKPKTLPFAELGARLFAARRAADLTRADVRAKIGMSEGVLVRYESGERQPPTSSAKQLADLMRVKYLPRLAATLRTTTYALLKSEPPRTDTDRGAGDDLSRTAADALLEIILEMRRLTGRLEGAHSDLLHRSADGGQQ